MKLLLKRRKKQHIANTTESGRSMVEILGVLAVVGVLSIGGIWGYTYAMDRYQANDILNAVNMRGKDTWNRFQDKELPDSEEIDEWEAHTSTGFPIAVIPIPDTEEPTFRVDVDNIPSRVCKMVLLGQYNSILAKVENDSGVSTYGTDLTICDDSIEQKVNMKFLWALNSETAETRAEEGTGKSCATTDDCTVDCERCNTERYVCEADCPEDTPVCCQETGVCVECESREDCGTDEICNVDTKQCEEPQKECPIGTFRAEDGNCYKCDIGNNIIINKDGYFSTTKFQDTLTGAESCKACANVGAQRFVQESGETTYCSFSCIAGIAYQSLSRGCVSCSDTTDYATGDNTTTGTNLCSACPNHKTYSHPSWPYYKMCGFATCETGEFKWFNPVCGGNSRTEGYCSPCGEFGNEKKYVGNNTHFIELCDNCPNRFYYKNETNVTINDGVECAAPCTGCGFCYPKCSQPDEDNSITICKEEGATSTNCKRQLQNRSTGACLPCNHAENVYVGTSTDSPFYQACLNCGRTVNAQGYCTLGNITCPIGTFKEYGTEQCVPCDSSKWKQIVDDETSGCTKNCRKSSVEATSYIADGAVQTKWVLKQYNNKTDKYLYRRFCANQCAGETKEFQEYGTGSCHSCIGSSQKWISQVGTAGGGYIPQLETLCEKCSDMIVVNNFQSCAPKSCGENNFRQENGICYACSKPETQQINSDDQTCAACGTRIVLEEKYCAYVDAGTSGVCNSVENGEHPNYPAGDGKLFRDREGYCRECTDSTSYTTSEEQCASCPNRRYEGGGCYLGLCTDKIEFLAYEANTSALTCVSCTSNTNKTMIPTNTDSLNLCARCADKRAMTHVDSSGNEMAGCVPKCLGTQWQALDGECLACAAKDSVTEIGNDIISRNQCSDCGRIVFSATADEKTTWYCSQYPEEEVHFIDITGNKVECTETGSIEILNLGKARNLCTKCGRSVITNDETGAVTCEL